MCYGGGRKDDGGWRNQERLKAGCGRSTSLAETLNSPQQLPMKSRESCACQDLDPSTILAHEAALDQKLRVPIVCRSSSNFEQSQITNASPKSRCVQSQKVQSEGSSVANVSDLGNSGVKACKNVN